MSPPVPAGRLLLIASLVALAVAGCGRRGALQPPPDPSAPQQVQPAPSTAGQMGGNPAAATPSIGTDVAPAGDSDDDDDETSVDQAIAPKPSATPRKRPKGFTIPKDPFILDPLL